MKCPIVSKKNLGDLIATNIACWIKKRTSIDELEYLKIKLGIEVILINLMKGIIVYGGALVLNIFYLELYFMPLKFNIATLSISFFAHYKPAVFSSSSNDESK